MLMWRGKACALNAEAVMSPFACQEVSITARVVTAPAMLDIPCFRSWSAALTMKTGRMTGRQWILTTFVVSWDQSLRRGHAFYL